MSCAASSLVWGCWVPWHGYFRRLAGQLTSLLSWWVLVRERNSSVKVVVSPWRHFGQRELITHEIGQLSKGDVQRHTNFDSCSWCCCSGSSSRVCVSQSWGRPHFHHHILFGCCQKLRRISVRYSSHGEGSVAYPGMNRLHSNKSRCSSSRERWYLLSLPFPLWWVFHSHLTLGSEDLYQWGWWRSSPGQCKVLSWSWDNSVFGVVFCLAAGRR